MSTEATTAHATPQPARVAAATNGQVVAKVREALDTARKAGQPTPGRPTLVRLTGATDHAVRKALAELAAEGTGPGGPGDEPSPTEPAATTRPDDGGRMVAWAGFVFGSLMSIAANVLHTWLPAPHQLSDWSPGVAAQIGAAVWPIGLLLSVEVLSRVRWPRGWQWALTRFGGTGAVALGSAMISYGATCVMATGVAVQPAGGRCRPAGARRTDGDLRPRPPGDKPHQHRQDCWRAEMTCGQSVVSDPDGEAKDGQACSR